MSKIKIERLKEYFERWIKLRNIVTNEYLDIKWKRISDFIKNSKPHLQKFINAVKGLLKRFC